MNSTLRLIIKILIPLVILVAAVGGARRLIKSRPEAPKQEREVRAYLVETIQAQRAEHRVDVRAQGTVEAATQLTLQAQVSGRITQLHEQLVPGGRLSSGEVVARVDPTDYKIAILETETGLEDARARRDVERGQQVIAQREWELFQQNASDERAALDPSLALRQPQLKIAQVAIDAAEARHKRARVDLERTTLRAPFNALVLSEQLERGQLITPQSVLATLVGTDTFWVRAALPLDQLSRVSIPGVNAAQGEGSQVMIEQDLGGNVITYQGQVIRLLGQLDQVGRMAQILVEVPDPLGLKQSAGQSGGSRQPPLLLGSYVQIVFEGSMNRELVELPRKAIHDGDRVWIYRSDGTLEVQQVTILARRPDTVLISEGLTGDEQVVISRIGSPIPGMKLRVAHDKNVAGASAERAQDAPGGER